MTSRNHSLSSFPGMTSRNRSLSSFPGMTSHNWFLSVILGLNTRRQFLPLVLAFTLLPTQLLAQPSEQSEATGLLVVWSNPSSARVYVDGRFLGTTPLEMLLEPGDHRLRVVKDGFLVSEHAANIVKGDRTEITAQLDRAAYLQVQSVPGGADLLVDGVKVAETPASVPVRPGERVVEVAKRGHETWTDEFNLIAGGRRLIDVNLPYKFGRLEILSVPNGATVFLDEERVGPAKPLILEEVMPGRHHLRLSMPTFEDAVREIAVERGETISIVQRLRHMQAYLEEEKEKRLERNTLIRRSIRIASLSVGVVAAVYASSVHQELKDKEDQYQQTAFSGPALRFREEVRDLEGDRNLWGGVAGLTLSVGLLTFFF